MRADQSYRVGALSRRVRSDLMDASAATAVQLTVRPIGRVPVTAQPEGDINSMCVAGVVAAKPSSAM
jgi:hypothetical protein